jgi:WD40 repeat protein
MSRSRKLLTFLKPRRLGVFFSVLIGLGVGFWQWGQPPRPRVVVDIGFGPRGYFSPNGQNLATVHGNDPFYLALWDVETGRKLVDLGKIESPRALAFSPNGLTLAGRFKDQISIWDLASGRILATYKDKDGENYQQMAFSPEGKLLAVRRNFVLWDVVANKIIKKLVQDGEEKVLEFGDSWLMVLGKDKRIKIWDLVTATLVPENRKILDPGESDMLANLGLSSNRRFLFYHKYTYHRMYLESVFTCDLTTGKTQEFRWNSKGRMAVETISPDGHTVAFNVNPIGWKKSWWDKFTRTLGMSGNLSDPHVILETFPSGEALNVLENCTAPMFSPDGRTLAVNGIGTDRKTLQLFDLPIRKPIGKILGLAGLAAVATLLAFNALGWLRKRRHKTA